MNIYVLVGVCSFAWAMGLLILGRPHHTLAYALVVVAAACRQHTEKNYREQKQQIKRQEYVSALEVRAKELQERLLDYESGRDPDDLAAKMQQTVEAQEQAQQAQRQLEEFRGAAAAEKVKLQRHIAKLQKCIEDLRTQLDEAGAAEKEQTRSVSVNSQHSDPVSPPSPINRASTSVVAAAATTAAATGGLASLRPSTVSPLAPADPASLPGADKSRGVPSRKPPVPKFSTAVAAAAPLPPTQSRLEKEKEKELPPAQEASGGGLGQGNKSRRVVTASAKALAPVAPPPRTTANNAIAQKKEASERKPLGASVRPPLPKLNEVFNPRAKRTASASVHATNPSSVARGEGVSISRIPQLMNRPANSNPPTASAHAGEKHAGSLKEAVPKQAEDGSMQRAESVPPPEITCHTAVSTALEEAKASVELNRTASKARLETAGKLADTASTRPAEGATRYEDDFEPAL